MSIDSEVLDYLVTSFKNCNFSDTQIKIMILKRSYYIFKKDNLEYKVNRYKEAVMEWGLTEKEAIDVIVENPRYIPSTKEWIRNHKDLILQKKKDRVKLAVKEVENLDDELNLTSIYEALLAFGISKKKVEYLQKDSRSAIRHLTVDEFYKRVEFFMDYGYTKDELIKKISSDFSFIIHDEQFFNERFQLFATIGITKQEFMDMYKRSYYGLGSDISQLQKVIDWFYASRFTKSQIKKISIKQPSVYNSANPNVGYTDKFVNLRRYGLSDDTIREMITECPTYLSTSVEVANDKIKLLFDSGFNNFEVVDILMGYPDYITNSIENISEKLQGLSDANILDILIDKPKSLIQGALLTKARVWYLKEKQGLIANNEQSVKKIKYLVFLNKKTFNNMFHLEDNELIFLYNTREKMALTLENNEEI